LSLSRGGILVGPDEADRRIGYGLRVRRGLVGVLAGGLVGAAFFAGMAGAETVTRGQTGADTACTTPADFVAVQTGVSGGTPYTVPSGEWTITSWSAAGGPPGQEALVVYRSTGTPNEYKVVGSTSAHALPNSQNTFSASIKVKGGDLIGFWAQAGTTCALATGSPSDAASVFFPSGIPSSGTTLTLVPGLAVGFRLNMQVTLEKGSGSGSSGSQPAAPVFVPQPPRIAICTAKPIQRADGTMGTFNDVLASQYPTSDPSSPYYGAAPANYAQGIGLTCDNLPGFTDAGYKVNGEGVRAPAGLEASWPAPYEYYSKTV
jgi:hypothetical protein